ncbi:MAG: alkaline phosphatase [Oscillospiraceae bacterium]|nr:alkaline phosphatase [Oscillospiraceae bacterium]
MQKISTLSLSKKILACTLAIAMIFSIAILFTMSSMTSAAVGNNNSTTAENTGNIPKYIFFFVGDGMSYVQIQAASYYLGSVKSDYGTESTDLSFMSFPGTGSATTYDLTSFAPDSASTATAFATGHKTWSGTINMDSTLTIPLETITEKLKKQLNYGIGIISSVNLDHATPAAFYAHQPSRSNTYEIGLELAASNFDYFAGGQLQSTRIDDKQPILEIAAEKGYKVHTTYAGAASLKPSDGKAILIAENIDSGLAMNYSLDAASEEWSLADYTAKGIEMLSANHQNGFFMMVEGGKIDWSGHANDAAANIYDVLAFDEAIKEALKFYEKNPDDTLIIVTGDHETGGMTIGFAGTDYDTFLSNISEQKVTYEVFSNTHVKGYKEDKTAFADVLEDVKELFGLVTAADAGSAAHPTLVLSNYELVMLQDAYTRTMAIGASSKANMTQAEYVLYGTYDPLTVTITHILNNKSGIGWTSYSHTGVPVPVFAKGDGSELFNGYYHQEQIFYKLAALTGVK